MSKRKILIVDDETNLLEVMEIFLMTLGFEVYRASNGVEAFQIFNTSSDIGLILSDVRMPGLNADGLTLLKNIREVNAKMPFVLMTGFADLDSSDIDIEGYDIVHKPYSLNVLENIVRKYLA